MAEQNYTDQERNYIAAQKAEMKKKQDEHNKIQQDIIGNKHNPKRGRILTDKNDVRMIPDEEKEAVFGKFRRFIDKELMLKKPLESITLSRWNYDKLEGFLLKYNKIDETNYMEPLSYRGIEIICTNDNLFNGYRPNYRNTTSAAQKLLNMEQNGEHFKIQQMALNKIIDKNR